MECLGSCVRSSDKDLRANSYNFFFQAIINNLENKLGYDMSESTKIAMRNYSSR